MTDLKSLTAELNQNANPAKAKILSGFFKTGKGQYGEGDIFLGLTAPVERSISKKYSSLSFSDIQKLLDSKIHEYRLTGLVILTLKYNSINKEKIDVKEKSWKQKEIFDFYLSNTKNINNWDLVDVTCPQIVGEYLLRRTNERKILYRLANSKDLWEKRISIISTLSFIRNNEFEDTIKISEILMNDKHDLIHKAVGWMLREVGKRDEKTEKEFLNKHAAHMPRTMLRYAIEKFDDKTRKKYLTAKVLQ